MAPTGRTPFTESDVTNLTKYLAIYAPGVDGRMGNKVYSDLTGNAQGRWPWSARHPWSSWREHYKKNSDMYDQKIKQYQRQKGATNEHTEKKPRLPAQQPNTHNAPSDTAKRKASNHAESLPDAKRTKQSPQPLTLPNGNRQRAGNSNGQTGDNSSETEDEDIPLDRQPMVLQKADKEAVEPNGDQQDVGRQISPKGNVVNGHTDSARISSGNERTTGPLASNGASRGRVLDGPKPFPLADKKPVSRTAGQSGSIARPKPKPRLIPRKDEDPFVSSPNASPTPSQISPARKPRKPPQYREGPFRNALVGQTSWPPLRGSQRRAPAPDPSPELANPSLPKISPPTIPHVLGSGSNGPPPPPSVLSSSKGVPSAQYTVVNAKASSSKNQLPPSKYKSVDDVLSPKERRSPPPLNNTDLPSNHAKPSTLSTVATKFSLAHQALNPSLGSRVRQDTNSTAPQARVNVPDSKRSALPSAPGRASVTGRNGRPSPHEAAPAATERETGRENGTAARESAEAHARGTDPLDHRQPTGDSDNDFFASSKSEEQRKHRRLDNVEDKPQSKGGFVIPRIDLKEVASSLSRRQSSTSSARTHSLLRSTSSSRRESYDSTASDSKRVRRSSSVASLRDLQRFAEVGRQQLLGQLAKRHGFDISVAFKAYERLQDLDATDTFLSELRRKAAKASVDLMQEMLPSDYEGNGERDSDAASDVSLNAVSSNQAQRRRQTKAHRESLSVRPLPEDDPGHISDYTPPRKSRAGRFTRRQGRDGGILHATPAWDSVMPHTQTPNILLEHQHSRFSRASEPDVASPSRPDRRSSLRVSLSPLQSSQNQVPPSTPPPLEQEEELEGSVTTGSGSEVQEVAEELGQSVIEEEGGGSETETEAEGDGDRGEMDIDVHDEDVEEGEGDGERDDDPDGDVDFSHLHPKNFFATLPPHQQEKQLELIKLSTTVNRDNIDAMRAWEAEQDPDDLEAHQAFLLQTLFYRINTGDPSPLTFDDYFN